jgi:hypothetical protein
MLLLANPHLCSVDSLLSFRRKRFWQMGVSPRLQTTLLPKGGHPMMARQFIMASALLLATALIPVPSGAQGTDDNAVGPQAAAAANCGIGRVSFRTAGQEETTTSPQFGELQGTTVPFTQTLPAA